MAITSSPRVPLGFEPGLLPSFAPPPSELADLNILYGSCRRPGQEGPDAADPLARLLLREEEVPREGVVIRRSYQAARWHDGRLFLWASNKVSVGRGEASSGLAYDALEG